VPPLVLSSDFEMEDLDNLAQAIKEEDCLVFAGAGLSAQATSTSTRRRLPTWPDLLRKMVAKCKQRGDARDLRTAINRGKYLVVAQELQERLQGQLGQCLRDLLSTNDMLPSEAHHLVVRLGARGILTSNYDTLLDRAYHMEYGGSDPRIVLPSQSALVINYLSKRSRIPFIFKVHGSMDDPPNVVLGYRDYARMVHESSNYRSVMETLFMTNTMLFVGFGATDPDLMSILERVATCLRQGTREHYLLVGDKTYLPFEVERLRKDLKLVCLTYKQDDAHSQMVPLLKDLHRRVRSSRAGSPTPVPTLVKQIAKARELWLIANTGRDLLRHQKFFERKWNGCQIRLILASPTGRRLEMFQKEFPRREVRDEVRRVTLFFQGINVTRSRCNKGALEIEIRYHPNPAIVMSISDPEKQTSASSAIAATQRLGGQSRGRPMLHVRPDDRNSDAFNFWIQLFQKAWGEAAPPPEKGSKSPRIKDNNDSSRPSTRPRRSHSSRRTGRAPAS